MLVVINIHELYGIFELEFGTSNMMCATGKELLMLTLLRNYSILLILCEMRLHKFLQLRIA